MADFLETIVNLFIIYVCLLFVITYELIDGFLLIWVFTFCHYNAAIQTSDVGAVLGSGMHDNESPKILNFYLGYFMKNVLQQRGLGLQKYLFFILESAQDNVLEILTRTLSVVVR